MQMALLNNAAIKIFDVIWSPPYEHIRKSPRYRYALVANGIRLALNAGAVTAAKS
jgi:hypothetical protein